MFWVCRPELPANRQKSQTLSITIDDSLQALLADRRRWLSARSMRTYEDVIDLLRDCLNGYGPNTLDEPDRQRWQGAYQKDEKAFCQLFGPERILPEVDEFLGYFMVRTVMAGQDLPRSAGTVTKDLAAWLHEHGHADETARDMAVVRGGAASRDLPRAERLATLLYEQRIADAAVDRAVLGPAHVVVKTCLCASNASSLGRCTSVTLTGPCASRARSPAWPVLGGMSPSP